MESWSLCSAAASSSRHPRSTAYNGFWTTARSGVSSRTTALHGGNRWSMNPPAGPDGESFISSVSIARPQPPASGASGHVAASTTRCDLPPVQEAFPPDHYWEGPRERMVEVRRTEFPGVTPPSSSAASRRHPCCRSRLKNLAKGLAIVRTRTRFARRFEPSWRRIGARLAYSPRRVSTDRPARAPRPGAGRSPGRATRST